MLTPEERETSFTQSALDRQDGVFHVYSCDPYWIRRLEKYGKFIKGDSFGKWFEIEHRQLSLRRPSHLLQPRKKKTSGENNS